MILRLTYIRILLAALITSAAITSPFAQSGQPPAAPPDAPASTYSVTGPASASPDRPLTIPEQRLLAEYPLGSCEFASGFDAEIKECTIAIDSGKFGGLNLSRALDKRAKAYKAKKQYDLALADLTRAITANPHIGWTTRGELYVEMGDKEHAIADYQKALELDPKNDQIRDALAYLGVTLPPAPP